MDTEALNARGLHGSLSLREQFVHQTGDQDIGACLGKALGNFQTDAPLRAGDNRVPAL